VDGDTLTRISRQYYGTANRWNEIFQANRDTLANEGSLTVGASLRIP
jgi:nucleoid-associated protein YgaU